MTKTEQQILEQMQMAKMAQMQGLVARANANPRSLTNDELILANQYANELGLDMSKAKERDVATTTEKWTARIGGGIDALAFGLIPDKWYSSYRTKDEMNQGKLIGNIAGLLVPGTGAIKGASALIKMAKTAKTLKSADAGIKATNLALNTIKTLKPKELVALANTIVRGTGIASAGLQTNNIGLGNNPQQNPYQSIMPAMNGMPQMP